MDSGGDISSIAERFRIIRPLGKGGMGEVYEALDLEHDERVALKTLHRASAPLLYHLKQEFRVLQGVKHPNLVRLGELIETKGRWFFTMELVRGCDFLGYVSNQAVPADLPPGIDSAATLDAGALVLDDTSPVPPTGSDDETVPVVLMDGGDPTPPSNPTPSGGEAEVRAGRAVPYRVDYQRLRGALRGAVRGLSALHAAGLIHRDVKPSNIMVDGDGRVVVLDFGLTRSLVRRRDAVGTVTDLLGTPAYMSPEQCLGKELSPASDFYSLGVALYEALTGLPPFRGTLRQVLDAERRTVPPPPSTFAPGVPADLDALCLALLAPDPAARPTAAALRDALGDDDPASGSWPVAETTGDHGALDPHFRGRADQLAALAEAHAEARAGAAVSVFIEGPSGIGKSALVRHFIDSLDDLDDAVVLTGRCLERESVPYKAFDSLIDELSMYLRSVPAPADEAWAGHIDALARLFPVLERGDRGATDGDADPRELRATAFAALRAVLTELGHNRSLILAIDDLQWGDADSAALLRELVRQPGAPAMLFIGTFRSEDADDPVLDQLVRGHRRIVVGPLDDDAARALAEALVDEQGGELRPMLGAITREGRGSPLLVGELVRHLHARGGALPEAGDERALLDHMLAERRAALPDDARRVLEVAAVVGRPIDRRLLVQVAELDRAAGRRALDLLAHVRLLRSWQQDDVEVFHDRVRAATVAQLGAERVKTIVARLVSVLDAAQLERPDLLGLDAIATVDPARALGYAVRAAEQAEAVYAFASAARLYELAITLAPDDRRWSLRLRHATVLGHAGYSADAAAVYLDLAARPDAPTDESVELIRLAADHLLRAGHIDEGLACLEQVASRLGVTLGRTRGRILLSIGLGRARLALRGLDYQRRSEADCSAEELARVDGLFSAATSLGMIDFLRGAVVQTEHLLAALSLGEPVRASRALMAEVAFLAATGGRAAGRAERLLATLRAAADELDDDYLRAGTRLGAGFLAFYAGDYRLADSHFGAASAQLAGLPGMWWERTAVSYWHHLVLGSMGELARLADSVPRIVREAEDRNDRHTRSVFKGHPTVWYLMRDDRADEIERELDSALDGWPEDGVYLVHHITTMGRAMVRLYQGRPAEALALLDRDRPLIRRLLIHRMPYIYSEVHKVRGMAAVAAGDRRALREALRGLDRFDTPIGRAYALLLRAAGIARGGDAAKAAAMLDQAAALFDACGANHDAAACAYRAGQLRGGSDGDALMAEALSFFDRQGVRNPAAFLAYLSPGFADPVPR